MTVAVRRFTAAVLLLSDILVNCLLEILGKITEGAERLLFLRKVPIEIEKKMDYMLIMLAESVILQYIVNGVLFLPIK